jgi:hypothetical protein
MKSPAFRNNMPDLNQYVLSRVLGSTMKPIKAPTFGSFGVLETIAEAGSVRYLATPSKKKFTLPQERLIAKSFEAVREGRPPDALLWDRALAAAFHQDCQRRGLDFSQEDLVRHLLCIRKNPRKFAQHGIVLAPTSQRDPIAGVMLEYVPAVEFALVRLRYLYGVSIDEILIQQSLGKEFERAAKAAAPHVSSTALRQTALALRKRRFIPQSSRAALARMDVGDLHGKWTAFRPLTALDPSDVPEATGLIELREASRDLYISRNDNLRRVLAFLTGSHPFQIMTTSFWQPDLSTIEARFIPDQRLRDAVDPWELKLLAMRRPVFNWPIGGRVA